MEQTNIETKILAVSNESSVLEELGNALKNVFSSAEIIKETDPLMACKYSFNNEVNYVFASEEMKRMSGSDLLQFIKKEHPTVKTYLIFNGADFSAETIYENFDGAIRYPFLRKEIEKTLAGDLAYSG